MDLRAGGTHTRQLLHELDPESEVETPVRGDAATLEQVAPGTLFLTLQLECIHDLLRLLDHDLVVGGQVS